jgi:hypothetical protein
MHHTSLAAVHSANGALDGGLRRRSFRFTVNPSRSNKAPIVLAAGHSICAAFRSSQARTFTGPHRTLSAWSVTSSASIAALTALWGLLAGITSPRMAIAIAGVLLLATPLLLPRRDPASSQEPEHAPSLTSEATI